MEVSVPDRVSVNVKNCARCGQNHDAQLFSRLSNPQDENGWWAFCPERREPVMANLDFDFANAPAPEPMPTRQERAHNVGPPNAVPEPESGATFSAPSGRAKNTPTTHPG